MSKNTRVLNLLVLLTLAALLLVACGGGEEAAEEAAPPPAATTAAAEPSASEPTAIPPTAAPEPTAVPPTAAPEPTAVPPTAEPAAEQPAEPPAAAGDDDLDPLATILNAQRSFAGIRSLRSTIISEDTASGMTFNTIVEFVPPDAYRVVNDFTQMIMLGGKTYVMIGEGAWQELPAGMGDLTQGLPDFTSDEEEIEALVEDMQVELRNVVYKGRETLDGREMRVYEYEADSAMELAAVGAARSTIWIGADDARTYKAITTVEAADGTVSTVTILYEYDLPIEIEAPTGN